LPPLSTLFPYTTLFRSRGMFADTLLVVTGEFGRSPRLGVSTSGNTNAPDGRDHWPYCYTALVAGAGIKRGTLYGKSDDQGSSPRSEEHTSELQSPYDLV